MPHPVLDWLVRLSVVGLVSGLLGGCMLMHGRGHGDDGHAGAPRQATCPVCGTTLKVGKRTPRATFKGSLRYFASEAHLREFISDPSRFPSPPAQSDAPAAGGHH